MDYLEMLEFGFFFMAGTLAIAILAREGHEWWAERHTRRSMKAIRQMENQRYAQEARDAVREAERFLREVRER